MSTIEQCCCSISDILSLLSLLDDATYCVMLNLYNCLMIVTRIIHACVHIHVHVGTKMVACDCEMLVQGTSTDEK